MKRSKTRMLDSEFSEKFSEICKKYNGVESPKHAIGEGKCFIVPTTHGPAQVSIHLPDSNNFKRKGFIESIYIRFTEFSTGKVFDSLHGYDFNGYSGKWNITAFTSHGTQRIIRESVLFDLDIRLEKVTHIL